MAVNSHLSNTTSWLCSIRLKAQIYRHTDTDFHKVGEFM